FKDTIGRKFAFPWSVCRTWKQMDVLIKQVFLHVDSISPYVNAGHYDLIGPDGKIILPQCWETVVQPGTIIEMALWPLHASLLLTPS
ncbi:hypothetical protein K490DRAFT_45461, partial [Saccharata proteae CBS 121410]